MNLSPMQVQIRFSSLVRAGLRFRSQLETVKKRVEPVDFEWYHYDSFTSLFPMERLRRQARLSMPQLLGGGPLLDLGTADGALAFLFESLGSHVDVCDHSLTNLNGMAGIRRLALALQSRISIEDVDLDSAWEPGPAIRARDVFRNAVSSQESICRTGEIGEAFPVLLSQFARSSLEPRSYRRNREGSDGVPAGTGGV